MKKTVRTIVTYQCNRSCPGCCNGHKNPVRKIKNIEEFLQYEEIIITGGEPVLEIEKVIEFIKKLDRLGYGGRMYLYCATYKDNIPFDKLDGFTYTLHYPCSDLDIYDLSRLSKELIDNKENFSHIINSRLMIDSRVYEEYDFCNIDFSGWDVIRKLKWKEYCKPAPNEELVEFLL